MACSSACHHGAIQSSEDEFGFIHPKIDEHKCINCNACRRVCPELNRVEMRFPLKCYACSVKDQSNSCKFASGGAASILAQYILDQGGVVVACSGEDIQNVHHKIYRKEDKLAGFAGSKYVQSYISPELLVEVRQLLKNGILVAMFGTGCQTAGFKNAFRTCSDNLVLVDLVCHGVPSQQMLNDNISYYESKYPTYRPQSVHFREKNKGNITYGWYGNDSDHKIAVSWRKDAYMAAFLDCLSIRPSCSECRYAFSGRATDITLSDFWGLGADCSLYGQNGVSAVLINTQKGLEILQALKNLNIEEREVGEAIKGVGRLQTPSPHNPLSEKFFELYVKEGFHKAVEKTTFAKFKRERVLALPIIGTLIRKTVSIRNKILGNNNN